MKKSKYIFMLSAALLGAACSDIIESSESVSFPDKEIILTATREGLQPGTRSFRLDDGSVWWSPAEEVSVFYGAGSNGGSKFVSMNTAIAETVELQGSVQMAGSGKDFWAVYPYSEDNSCDGSSITTVIPDVQIGVEGNFSGDVFPAVAKSSSMTLAFWNICGGVKFFVSRSDIKSVTFKGNNNEPLAGKVKVTFGSDGTPVVQEVIDAKTEVTLVAPDGGFFKPGKYYYITLLPASLDKGITMVFTTETEKGELVSDKAQTVKRSIFGVLKNIDAKVSTWESTVTATDYVDLGLSVKWATFNVGATKPEEYGEYFAWGETEPKSNYGWAMYKWYNGSNKQYSKYCTQSSYWGGTGPMDNKAVLDPEDDAAHASWGGSWRMPTEAEWYELITNCTWMWTSDYNGTGVKGQIVSASNGNSIFLPAAGSMSAILSYAGTFGYYWASSLSTYASGLSWIVQFNSDEAAQNYYQRFYGMSVRPVYGEFIPVSSISLDKTSLELYLGKEGQLTATTSPSNATEQMIHWASSDDSVAYVNYNGVVTALAPGTATITAYGSSGVSATCLVTVKSDLSLPASVEAVDLGLPSGLKWATMNVGATKPEEYGAYFAWGETAPKSDYSWPTYKWCNGSYKTQTKYNTSSSYGTVDSKTVLDPEDDAAHVYWGGSWRMPTDAEWTELRDNCTWTWTTENGVKERKVTGPNGKSIFLPAAGFRSDSCLYNVGSSGLYWSSSLNTGYPGGAWSVAFNSVDVSRGSGDYGYRYYGLSVRPVTE